MVMATPIGGRLSYIGYEAIEALQSINVAQFVAEARAREDVLRARRKVVHAKGP